MDERMSGSYRDVITLGPGKRSGQTTIRGLRIAVYDVLLYLAAEMSHQDILSLFPSSFPHLREAAIRTCLSYATDRERHLFVAHV
jgi:uncharacterized protein (DUF433 family)